MEIRPGSINIALLSELRSADILPKTFTCTLTYESVIHLANTILQNIVSLAQL